MELFRKIKICAMNFLRDWVRRDFTNADHRLKNGDETISFLWSDAGCFWCRHIADIGARAEAAIIPLVVSNQSSSIAGADGIAGVEPSASLVENLRENSQEPLTRLFFHFIFPASSLDSLRLFSQIGVCLFMFVVGMELDVSQLKQQARTAVLVSRVSILFSYLLGVVSAPFLFSTFAGPATTFTVFALFIGISMNITAFPVLARILEERGLTKSPLGITALICAAMNDVTAWCRPRLGSRPCQGQKHDVGGLQHWAGGFVCFGDAVLDQAILTAFAQPHDGRRWQAGKRRNDRRNRACVCLRACDGRDGNSRPVRFVSGRSSDASVS
jgi:hypothetical protein